MSHTKTYTSTMTSALCTVRGTNHLARKRTSNALSPPQRSRSSPVRSNLSFESPERRGRSPSVSRVAAPAIPHLPAPILSNFNENFETNTTVAYYSAHPPATPIYLVPFASHKIDISREIYKIQDKSRAGTKIVKNIIQSILKNIMKSKNSSRSTEKMIYESKSFDAAIQTMSNETDRSNAIKAENVYSVSNAAGEHATCQWAGEVRALQESHERLLLRELRQLRDLMRLGLALRRHDAPQLPT